MSTPMSPSLLTEFVQILGALSPENLMADGERPLAAARRIERSLRTKWKALETKLGRPVSEDEVWTEFMRSRTSGGVGSKIRI